MNVRRRQTLISWAIAGLASAAAILPSPPALAADAARAQATATEARLIALLPMRGGFGPADQDAYEKQIAPIAAEHGMVRDSAYSIREFLGGPGPKHASTLGDRIHDMAATSMYLITPR